MGPRSVFLNVPYYKEFEPLFLAYIVGVIGFGLLPRATLEIQGSTHRLSHIVDLLHACYTSIHDLSRVELTEGPLRVPRFNMPFELGLAYHHSVSGSHHCFIFAENYTSFEKSLSDLKGIDIQEHGKDASRVFSRLTAAFVAQNSMPTVKDMNAVYELVMDNLPNVLENAGSQSLYHPRVFLELVFTANSFWKTRQVIKRSSQA